MGGMVWVCFFMFLFFSLPADSRPVKKTDNNKVYSIEIRVIVDNWAFEKWASIANADKPAGHKPKPAEKKELMALLKKYVHSVFVGVNAVFEGLKTVNISLDARIADIKFITDEHITEGTEKKDKAHMHKVLDIFHRWLLRKGYPNADHSVLFTGLDLSDGVYSQVVGVANLGGMCSDHSVSAVEALPDGNTVLTFVHELAHSLNVHHDGHRSSSYCSRDSLMIMDGTRSKASPKNFLFSQCSKDNIKRFLHKLDEGRRVLHPVRDIWQIGNWQHVFPELYTDNCLLPDKTTAPAVKGQPLGQLLDPDIMCKMSAGPQSYLARKLYGPKGLIPYSDVCYTMRCVLNATWTRTVLSADGFVCGPGKVCKLGVCEKSSSRSRTSAADNALCPFGDPPAEAVVYRGLTCREAVSKHSHYCRNTRFARTCCASCQSQSSYKSPSQPFTLPFKQLSYQLPGVPHKQPSKSPFKQPFKKPSSSPFKQPSGPPFKTPSAEEPGAVCRGDTGSDCNKVYIFKTKFAIDLCDTEGTYRYRCCETCARLNSPFSGTHKTHTSTGTRPTINKHTGGQKGCNEPSWCSTRIKSSASLCATSYYRRKCCKSCAV